MYLTLLQYVNYKDFMMVMLHLVNQIIYKKTITNMVSNMDRKLYSFYGILTIISFLQYMVQTQIKIRKVHQCVFNCSFDLGRFVLLFSKTIYIPSIDFDKDSLTPSTYPITIELCSLNMFTLKLVYRHPSLFTPYITHCYIFIFNRIFKTEICIFHVRHTLFLSFRFSSPTIGGII